MCKWNREEKAFSSLLNFDFLPGWNPIIRSHLYWSLVSLWGAIFFMNWGIERHHATSSFKWINKCGKEQTSFFKLLKDPTKRRRLSLPMSLGQAIPYPHPLKRKGYLSCKTLLIVQDNFGGRSRSGNETMIELSCEGARFWKISPERRRGTFD